MQKKDIIKRMKDKIISKLLKFLSRIKMNNSAILTRLLTAYVRSVMQYHATPLLAAGIIDESFVLKYDRYLKRRLFMLPNDIKNEVV